MTIDFGSQRWERLAKVTDSWWAGELDRPLIDLRVRRPERRGPRPAAHRPCWPCGYDFAAVTPETVVDCWEWELAGYEYLADAYPGYFNNWGMQLSLVTPRCSV